MFISDPLSLLSAPVGLQRYDLYCRGADLPPKKAVLGAAARPVASIRETDRGVPSSCCFFWSLQMQKHPITASAFVKILKAKLACRHFKRLWMLASRSVAPNKHIPFCLVIYWQGRQLCRV